MGIVSLEVSQEIYHLKKIPVVEKRGTPTGAEMGMVWVTIKEETPTTVEIGTVWVVASNVVITRILSQGDISQKE